MSLLPQRKKSPEEIAQLRESLGIPSLFAANEKPEPLTPDKGTDPLWGIPATQGVPQPIVADSPPASPVSPVLPPAPHPAPSLIRSEQSPTEEESQPAAAEPALPVVGIKPVRSLRKSEQVPLSAMRTIEPPADSNLPCHRHSDDELNEIRRRDALAMLTPVVNPKHIPAHPVLIAFGYLAVLAGAVSASMDAPAALAVDTRWIRLFGHALAFDPRPLMIPLGCVIVALLTAACIFLYRPFSRHHAAFISVITLLVIIFGALHYFPQLRHGT